MLDSICVHNGKVFVVDLEANLISFSYLKRSNTEKENQTFQESQRFKIPLPDTFLVKNVLLDTIENYSLGFKSLIAVVISILNDVSIYLYCDNISSNIFHIKTSDLSNLSDLDLNSNLFVTNGPAVLLSSAYEQYICAVSCKYESNWDHSTCVPTDNGTAKVIQFTSIGQLVADEPINVLLLIQSYENETGCKEMCASSLGIKIKQDNTPIICHKLPLHHFFPMHFQNAAKMVNVWGISILGQHISEIKDINWKCNYSFLCTDTESLVFCDGKLQYVFEQEGLIISSIKTEFCEMFQSSLNLILVSEAKDVYLLTNQDSSFKDNPSLMLSKMWPNIKSVFSGDVLMNGSRQLLLLNNTSCDTWQDGYILSDISSFVPIDYTTQITDAESSMTRAIPGVQAKVLAGELAIAKAKSNISRKMEATFDSLYRLNTCSSADILVEHHVSSFREGLVNLILQKDETCHLERDNNCRVKLSLLKHWKRILGDRLVLFWTFSNDDNRVIYNPTISMWISNHHIQYAQRVVVHKCETFSLEDECRKQITPKERFSVTVSLEIPEFYCESFDTHAILSWHTCSSAEFENELFLPLAEKALTQQQMLLETDLSTEEIFNANLKNISTLEDLACVQVLQQKVTFTFLSLVTDLRSTETLLLSDNLLIIENSNLKILVFQRCNWPLFGAHIIFRTINQTSVEAQVFTRNEKETLLLEEYLYRVLPSDVLILPSGMTSDETMRLKQQAVCCMKDEADLLLSMMSVYNVQEPVAKLGLEPGTVVISKETYRRMRKVLLKKECMTDSVMQTLSNLNFFSKADRSGTLTSK